MRHARTLLSSIAKILYVGLDFRPRHFGKLEADMRYAHTLLFVCPYCDLPIAVSQISHEKNLEGVQSATVQIECEYCSHSFEAKGYEAQMHWVTEWNRPRGVPLAQQD
jgi:hypothetical protein